MRAVKAFGVVTSVQNSLSSDYHPALATIISTARSVPFISMVASYSRHPAPFAGRRWHGIVPACARMTVVPALLRRLHRAMRAESDDPVPAGRPALSSSRDPESEAWVRSLGTSGAEREDAVRQLHELLVRAARAEARRRADHLGITGPEVVDLAIQAASDALVTIVAKLDQFRGESRFSTWAYKFAIFEVSTKFRRHFWTTPTTPMGPEEWERLPDRFGIEPDNIAERRELIDAMHVAVTSALTARQREIFVAIVLRGVPLDVLVEQLGSNRNAIYKTLFDARRKLRAALAANGHLDRDEVRCR